MNQVILVLEENLEIQRLITSSLKDSEVSIINESNPELFLQQLRNSDPDLIFLSNTDSVQDYKICREIRNDISLEKIPIILLLNSKDNFDDFLISDLSIDGTLRKPFEASKLKKQLSKFISLDENFGNGPKENEEDFKIDMSGIGNQLQEIRDVKKYSDKPLEGLLKTKDKEKNKVNTEITNLEAIEMDSMMLGNVSQSEDDQVKVANVNNINNEEERLIDDSKSVKEGDSKIGINTAEKKDNEMDMESGFEFDLKLDEDEEDGIPKMVPFDKNSSSFGLEKLKKSGLEDQFAENRLSDKTEEIDQELGSELNDIDLDVNDFEEQKETWERPDALDLYHQTPREGLADINLDESDFKPEFPKNLSSFGDTNDLSLTKLDEISKEDSEIPDGMDNIELEQDLVENFEGENQQDNILLVDSDKQDNNSAIESEEVEELQLDSNLESEGKFDYGDDTEIKSMVNDSFNFIEGIEETGLGELEDLSSQMAELESEDAKLETENVEFESEGLDDDTEEMNLETEGLDLETEELELETEGLDDETEEMDLETEGLELESEEFDDETEEMDLDTEQENEKLKTNEALGIDEDVFENWDDAEDAFINFDRKPSIQERITNDFNRDHEDYEKSESYSFTEKELKEIVSSSVQKALEKSIASSLVELAVSELKTTVGEMDQDWV